MMPTQLLTRTADRCEVEHGPSLAAETARRLAGDASIVPILENSDGEPLNVGWKTRGNCAVPSLRTSPGSETTLTTFPIRPGQVAAIEWSGGFEKSSIASL
jgi:hypothetical protein